MLAATTGNRAGFLPQLGIESLLLAGQTIHALCQLLLLSQRHYRELRHVGREPRRIMLHRFRWLTKRRADNHLGLVKRRNDIRTRVIVRHVLRDDPRNNRTTGFHL